VVSERTVVRRAPGKLFVAGEYAVVEPGGAAVLVAVDRQVTVSVAAPGAHWTRRCGPGAVVVRSDLLPAPVGWRRRDGRLAVCGADAAAGAGLSHVVAAVEVVCALLAERGGAAPALEVSVTSRLHEDGRKFGLGSSGAVTVATVAAVAAFCGLQTTAEERFRLAMIAGAGLDAKGSGGDLAASTWGGWILYRSPDRAFVADLARRRGVQAALREPWPHLLVRPLPAPAGLSLQVGWTGRPASTAALVADLHRRPWRGTPAHRRFTEASGALVQAAATALEEGDAAGLLTQIRLARRELARLDGEVGLGIFTPALTALCDAAEAFGGAGKPSGAGGGDCGIALMEAAAARDISELRQRWETAGVLPLPVGPALEGIEK
jgi:phosphomevalonate kinase